MNKHGNSVSLVDGHIDEPKMTNYDRIKEMSLEEMAARFVLKDDKYNFYYCLDGFAYGTRRIAIEMNMEWLKKEVGR